MNAAQVETANVLDALEFNVECEQCSDAAAVYAGCRFCGSHVLLCDPHWQHTLSVMVARMAARGAMHLRCGNCKHVAPSLRELVEVIPL